MSFQIEQVKCIHHTKAPDGSIKALKVIAPFFGYGFLAELKPAWVPNWAVSDDSPVWHTGDEGILLVKESYAEKQGWIK